MSAAGGKATDDRAVGDNADRASRPRGGSASGLALRRAAVRSACAGLVLALSACAGIGTGASGGPGKPVQGPDSLAMECPSEFRYELPLPAGASLEALRATGTFS
jgi:hypothetical protein